MIKIKNVQVKKETTKNKKWVLTAERLDGAKFLPIRFSTENQAKKHITNFDFCVTN